jgi:CelD/BcsL family acetyltransferase involved in cellulose biosynthesis
LHIVVHTKIPEENDLRQSWDDLVQRMEQPEVFYTYEWAISVQRAYSSRLPPLLMLGYEGTRLIGVASLAIDETESVVFLAQATADYCDLLSTSEDRTQWLSAVLRELRRRGRTRVALANLPADSASVAALAAGTRQHRYRCFTRRGYLCAQVFMGDAEQRDSLRHNISSKKMLRRNLRAMEKLGGIVLSTESRWEDAGPILPRFYESHVGRFLSMGRISNIADPQRRNFLDELARQLSSRGWLAMSRFSMGERSIAWNYGFQYGGSWFWYQPTFDSDYETLSPGYCLLAKIVKSACDRSDIHRVDLGLGAEGYKERFATSARETLHVSLNCSYRDHATVMLRYRMGAAVRRSPGLERVARRTLTIARTLSKRVRQQSLREVLGWLAVRMQNRLFGKDQVLFFEAPGSPGVHDARENGGRLVSLTLAQLAEAAMRYSDDDETLTYLLRAAQRLRAGAGAGFALLGSDEIPVHFAWVTDFQEFHMAELDRKLTSPGRNAKLIFDCWTPTAMRGQGFYSRALVMLAARLRSMGQRAWVFGAATNEATLRGIGKAGFEYRMTLGRRRWLGFSWIADRTRTAIIPTDPLPAVEQRASNA